MCTITNRSLGLCVTVHQGIDTAAVLNKVWTEREDRLRQVWGRYDVVPCWEPESLRVYERR
jgi:hypothetical protein